MELFPYNNLNVTACTYLGLLYDQDIPVSGERGIHSTFNEAVGVRVLQRTQMTTAPYRLQFSPYSASGFVGNNFYPAWVEVNQTQVGNFGYGAAINVLTRIVPKIRFPALDQRFAGNVNNYNEAIAVAMLAHRIGSMSAFVINQNSYLSPMYNLTQEGWYLCAEYDFGAEMELKALVGASMGAGVTTLFLLRDANTYLQAFVNDQWVDVCATNPTVGNTASNASAIAYVLPTTVKAQKFRLVNRATSWPWSTTGHYPFSLQFYGNYTGTKPRTLGKIKHLSLLHLEPTTYSSSTQWQFNSPADVTTILGRYFSMTHLSVTDDLKQAASFDICVQDANYSMMYGDSFLPTFRVKVDAIVGRGV